MLPLVFTGIERRVQATAGLFSQEDLARAAFSKDLLSAINWETAQLLEYSSGDHGGAEGNATGLIEADPEMGATDYSQIRLTLRLERGNAEKYQSDTAILHFEGLPNDSSKWIDLLTLKRGEHCGTWRNIIKAAQEHVADKVSADR